MNHSVDEILNLDKTSFQGNFKSTDFGLKVAQKIISQHKINAKLERVLEGSNLIFKIGEDLFLKIIPSFNSGTYRFEVASVDLLHKHLPFSTPSIVHADSIGEWKYIISKKVAGEQLKYKFRDFNRAQSLEMASEIGKVIGCIYKANGNGPFKEFTPWKDYLPNRISKFKSIQLEKGNSEDWSVKLNKFILLQEEMLLALDETRLIHADLNHEHILINQEEENWKISGIIDFADSMEAPIELEFVLPILCFFKGDSECQSMMWRSSGILPQFELKNYSEMMMSLALKNKFLAFHDWFSKEIREGAKTVEEVAGIVFPDLRL